MTASLRARDKLCLYCVLSIYWKRLTVSARAAHADAPHSSIKDVTSVFFFLSFFQSIYQKPCPFIVLVSIWTDEPKVGWGEGLGPHTKSDQIYQFWPIRTCLTV